MNCIYVLCFVAVAAVCGQETYSTENDDLDIDAVVNNLEKLRAYHQCFMGTSACDNVSGDFKKDIPDAVKTACIKCTPAQKRIFKIYLDGLKVNLPKENEAFKAKFDPEGKYFTALEAAVANA